MKLSIIVPVFNSEAFLHECIDSILQQTFTDFEVILVDDGSTDASAAICDDYAKRDSRVQVLHKQNAGQSQARNDGIRLAQGEYILMPDSDDLIDPHMCEEMLACADKTDADCVCAGYERLLTNGQRIPYPEVDAARIYKGQTQIKDELLPRLIGAEYKHIRPLMPSACTKLYRRQLLMEHSILFADVNKVFSEDLLFNFQVFCKAEKVAHIPQVFYTYRTNEASTSHSYNCRKQTSASHLYRIFLQHPYIQDHKEFHQMVAADILGLFSVHIKLLVAGDITHKITVLKEIMDDDAIHEMAMICQLKQIRFPLNVFCLLIRHKMKYTLYLLIKLFLLIT